MQKARKATVFFSAHRRMMWIGLGVMVAVIVGVGSWFGTHADKPRPRSNRMAANVASSPGSSDVNETAGASDGIQVDLGPDDLKKAHLQTVHVDTRPTDATLRVPAVVKPDEYHEVHVTPLVGGVIKQVPVVLGDHVRRGQTLAVIFSSDLATAESDYLAFSAEVEADGKKLDRTETLLKLGAASQQEEEQVTAEHHTHQSHVRAALEKLRLLGASDRQIAALTRAAQIDANLIVPAPIDGTILTRNANLGLVTNATQELFTVTDLSTVWAIASINEKDFSTVRIGTTAAVTTAAYPGRVWKGRVVYIQPQVDPNTRTAQARIEVKNPGESLRLEMYMDVAFTSQAGTGLAVPASAVQAIGEKQYVFLPVKDSDGSFAVRQVRLGPLSGGYYPVLDGLKLNDEVVNDGSFILKAEATRQHPEL